MIGKVCISVTPYYDRRTQRNSFKRRPVLILGDLRNNDYTVLPISRVTIQVNLDPEYDIKIDPSVYPNLCLNCISYVRTHKRTTVHSAAVTNVIGDMKNDYPDLYVDVLAKVEEYDKSLINGAI